ncbi:phosphonate metabolism protein/1,5-bisphosphokinase (PRPP-forming) PhnN [Arenibacterium sp. CAU 1754]
MTGRIYTIVGPSGAGKDTLIGAAHRARPDLQIVRRAITRPAEAGGEPFQAVTMDEFNARSDAGDFVLSWQAHGLCYGIPKTVLDDLEQGQDVLFNGSRAMLGDAVRVFPGLLVLHVTARPDILAARLTARGREGPRDIDRRLKRAALPLPEGLHVIEIDNSGALEDATSALLAALAPAGVCGLKWEKP